MGGEARTLLANNLKACFEKLHRLDAPGPSVNSFPGGPLSDYSVYSDPLGPFKSEAEFFDYRVRHIPYEHQDRIRALDEIIIKKGTRLCFTHNVIAPQNIIIDENDRLSGIIDWECAGWLPEWWEYTKSMYRRDFYKAWMEVMDQVHPTTYPEESKLERAIWAVN